MEKAGRATGPGEPANERNDSRSFDATASAMAAGEGAGQACRGPQSNDGARGTRPAGRGRQRRGGRPFRPPPLAGGARRIVAVGPRMATRVPMATNAAIGRIR
ncbi:hypothetical protein Bpla01_59310 [Burkholderia plantarii]|nr:hypothetical protein Bpla01_59310 [Burkholderia plantarii]